MDYPIDTEHYVFQTLAWCLLHCLSRCMANDVKSQGIQDSLTVVPSLIC